MVLNIVLIDSLANDVSFNSEKTFNYKGVGISYSNLCSSPALAR